MPGHANRYANERPAPAADRSWAVHQVIHFKAAKLANDKAHMNSHAGKRSRNNIAAAGMHSKGSHPGHPAVTGEDAAAF
jgi:hypothetical protein